MLRFRLKLSLLVVVLLPILISLGVWQVSRYQDKLKLEQVYESRRQLAPLSLSSLSDLESWSDPLFLPLEVTGQFISNQYFLLDNQVFQGKPGYQVLMPFVSHGGDWLLINRGWIPLQNRETLPEITTPSGTQTIQGRIYRSFGDSFMLSEDLWSEGWPKRIQSLDFDRIEKTLNRKLPAITLVLSHGEPGAEQVKPISINMKSEKHLAYAIQWFAMALVLVGLYIFRMRRPPQNRPVKQEG